MHEVKEAYSIYRDTAKFDILLQLDTFYLASVRFY